MEEHLKLNNFKKRIHQSNLILHESTQGTGMIGNKQSEILGRLSHKIDLQKKTHENKDKKNENVSSEMLLLTQKIKDLEREENNMKREMSRLSELAKNNKNSKIAI